MRVQITANRQTINYNMLFIEDIYRVDLILHHFHGEYIYVRDSNIQNKRHTILIQVRQYSGSHYTILADFQNINFNFLPNVAYKHENTHGDYKIEFNIV